VKSSVRFSAITVVMLAAFLGAFLLGPPAGALAADAGDLLPAGEAAPKFEAVDIDGQPFSLEEELSRGPVFLVFWSIF
jgi:hypothetical protein